MSLFLLQEILVAEGFSMENIPLEKIWLNLLGKEQGSVRSIAERMVDFFKSALPGWM